MKENGIQAHVIEEIIALAKKYNLNQVILFGSRARGDYKSRSDIDLAVSGGDCIRFSLDVQEMTSTLLYGYVITFSPMEIPNPLNPDEMVW